MDIKWMVSGLLISSGLAAMEQSLPQAGVASLKQLALKTCLDHAQEYLEALEEAQAPTRLLDKDLSEIDEQTICTLMKKHGLKILRGHEDWVNSVAISADSTKAVSGSDDDTVGVWDLKGGTHTRLEGHEDCVNSVAISADGTKAVSGSDDKTVGVWDL